MAVEGRLRQGDRAKSLDTEASDRGSTRWVGAAFGASMLLMVAALALDWFHVATLPDGTPVGWIGIGLMLVGLGMRIWAARVLGRFYTRTLVTQGDQTIVRDGPYRFVRHPGYLGLILVWIGAALAAADWVTIILIPLLILPAYVFRIHSEEAMLAQTFGDQYREYQRQSWRLLPPLY